MGKTDHDGAWSNYKVAFMAGTLHGKFDCSEGFEDDRQAPVLFIQ